MQIRIQHVAASIFFAFGVSSPASAQYAPFPCTWAPGERQVGQTMQGPVVVPLCVNDGPTQSTKSQGDTNDEDDDHYVPGYIPGPRPEPPKGWRPLYGAFVEWVVTQDENGDNPVYSYAYILNQETPEMARQKVVEACMKDALFPEPGSDCFPQMFNRPYVVVIQYPHHPSYSERERGMYKAFEMTTDEGFLETIFEREPGKREYCPNGPNHHQPCAKVIAMELNGVWPERKGGRKRR